MVTQQRPLTNQNVSFHDKPGCREWIPCARAWSIDQLKILLSYEPNAPHLMEYWMELFRYDMASIT